MVSRNNKSSITIKNIFLSTPKAVKSCQEVERFANEIFSSNFNARSDKFSQFLKFHKASEEEDVEEEEEDDDEGLFSHSPKFNQKSQAPQLSTIRTKIGKFIKSYAIY